MTGRHCKANILAWCSFIHCTSAETSQSRLLFQPLSSSLSLLQLLWVCCSQVCETIFKYQFIERINFSCQCGDFVALQIFVVLRMINQWLSYNTQPNTLVLSCPLSLQLYDKPILRVTPRADIGETFSLCLSMNFSRLFPRWNTLAPTIFLIPVYLKEAV